MKIGALQLWAFAMPIKFNNPVPVDRVAADSRFDAAVRRLAPIINELRENRSGRSTRTLAQRLNQMGELGPTGKLLSYGTMRRVLQRMPELWLGDGPNNRSVAAANRVSRDFRRPSKHEQRARIGRARAELTRALEQGPNNSES